MADKKKRNFKGMAEDELRKELEGLSKSLHGLRTQTVTSTVENKALFRTHRRDVARILTELRARELRGPVRGPKPAVATEEKATPAKAAEDKAAATAVKPPKAKAKAKPKRAAKSVKP
jgi:large subunit ribosomal protein L29